MEKYENKWEETNLDARSAEDANSGSGPWNFFVEVIEPFPRFFEG